MQSVCVFLSSADGDAEIRSAIVELGEAIARSGKRLVYGGASIGLMGVIADTALAAGGEVVGVVPHWLADREIAHTGLTEIFMVETMHERKAKMAELADGFVVAPGGFGTLEEAFEVLTALQIGLSTKPVVFLDIGGFWQQLSDFLRFATERGIIRPSAMAHFSMASSVQEALARLTTC